MPRQATDPAALLDKPDALEVLVHLLRRMPESKEWALLDQMEVAGETSRRELIHQLLELAESRSPAYEAGDIDQSLRGIRDKADWLWQQNKRHLERFKRNPLMRLVQVLTPHPTETTVALLDALQVWSDAFQTVLHARVQHETDPVLLALAQEHLAEERDHHLVLAMFRGRTGLEARDPKMAVLCGWFVAQMYLLSGPERVVLVHLVLEASGEIFPQAARHAFPQSEYFALHADEDGDHAEQGYRVLRGLPGLDWQALGRVLAQGWKAMNALCTRIAELALQERGGKT